MSRRRRVDEAQAQKACEAVMGGMSVRKAATSFGVGRPSIATRLAGKVSMDGRVGPGTILSEAEENAVEDVLLFAARNGLSLGRAQLKDAVGRLCDDGRPVPWDREKGPGRAWVSGFLRRHPRVSERRNGVYEATKEDIEPRIEAFCKIWAAAVEEYAPAPDHLH
ncbi:unnamed protein product, partial [Ectocarpus sp. 13 AM-2016]